jgi:hypothetical protein
MKKLIMLLISAMLVFACATEPAGAGSKSKKKPAWLENKNSVYPEDKFLSAIGEGDTLKEAQAQAAANLASIFKVSVQVESTLQSRYVEYSQNGVVGNYGEETVMTDNITQTTDQTLLNLKLGETFTDSNGVVFTIAYLNRSETGGVYKQIIEENGALVGRLMARSAEQTDTLKKYAFLDAAYVVASNNELLIEQLGFISPSTRKGLKLGYDMAGLKKQRADTAAQMVFSIRIDNDSGSQITNMLTSVLTSQGFSVNNGGNIVLTGSVSVAPVKLDNNYENVKWYLMITVKDASGVVVVSLEKNSRSSGVSASAAEARAYKDMEGVIKKDFVKQLTGYFDSHIEK